MTPSSLSSLAPSPQPGIVEDALLQAHNLIANSAFDAENLEWAKSVDERINAALSSLRAPSSPAGEPEDGALVRDVVAAWEALPAGSYGFRLVERWLTYDMKPVIDRCRAALASPVPPPLPGEAAWRYSINYGPDGEENYAMVYDGAGTLVGNLKTYHAQTVVGRMNASATPPASLPVSPHINIARDAARAALEAASISRPAEREKQTGWELHYDLPEHLALDLRQIAENHDRSAGFPTMDGQIIRRAAACFDGLPEDTSSFSAREKLATPSTDHIGGGE